MEIDNSTPDLRGVGGNYKKNSKFLILFKQKTSLIIPEIMRQKNNMLIGNRFHTLAKYSPDKT